MKRIKLSILFFSLGILPLLAQTGTWRAYMSYHEPQQIVKAGEELFVRASNGLYQYNLNDHSISTYDKVSGLSDTYITLIGWNTKAARLIVVYDNSNLDLIDRSGNITNISALYSKSMTQDKTVNAIYMNDVHAYLATGFGVVKVNMQRSEVAETYILNRNIKAIGISGSNIYAKADDDVVLTASLQQNLINPNTWSVTADFPPTIFDTNNSDWQNYHDLVATLQPGGPHYNHFAYMRHDNNRLLTCGGGWRDGSQFLRPGCMQTLTADGQWQIVSHLKPSYGNNFIDATSVAVDPNDDSHMFISTCGTGLYELKNGQVVNNYSEDNSPLTSAIKGNDNFVRVDGLVFDNNGFLWMTCSAEAAQSNTLLRLNPTTGEWKTYNDDALYHNREILYIMRNAILDHQGCIWLCNDHSRWPALLRIDPQSETITRYDNFTNQDNSTQLTYYVRAVAEDLEQNIWIGTDQGLFMYDQQQQADPALGYTQIKVPRNDGTNYADYLMAGSSITAIAVDGGNRKWLGTDGNGVYLISADNMEQLHHFTTDNSPLISNNIESIAINNTTGEVFFGTSQGLCSYMADATVAAAEADNDLVYAYPNPVPHDYQGLITIVGLSYNADVKILTSNGSLVAEGRSNGGTFTWNGRDKRGRRVASGVYTVVSATADGKKGTVSRIAIVK